MPTQSDLVIIRCVKAKTQRKFERVVADIRNPFDEYDEGKSTTHAGSIDLRQIVPPSEWVIVVEFEDSDWYPVFSNKFSESELFDLACEGADAEVVRLTCDNNLRLEYCRAREFKLTFEAQAGRKTWDLQCFDMEEVEEQASKHKVADDVFRYLCNRLKIRLPIPVVAEANNNFTITSENNQPFTSGISTFTMYEKEHGAVLGQQLDEAITESGNPLLVKAAIEAGALSHLEDPLHKAVFSCGRMPRWAECAEVLLDAGCDVNAVDRHGSPIIVGVTDHLLSTADSKRAIDFLLSHGVDVNQPNKHGQTAIYNSAFNHRKSVVRLLIQHGADAGKKFAGKSTIDRLREIADSLNPEAKQEFEEMIALCESLKPQNNTRKPNDTSNLAVQRNCR